MITVVSDLNLVKVPSLISGFRCGFDRTYSDGFDYDEVPMECVKGVSEPYVITISGDSMEPELRHGDKLIIDVNKNARHNDIVAVYLNGDMLVKRLMQNNFSTYLHSDNSNYKAYKIKESDNFEILGVIVNLYRKL